MKKLVKLIMVLVLVMVSGCTTQKKEANARVIDTSIFLYFYVKLLQDSVI